MENQTGESSIVNWLKSFFEFIVETVKVIVVSLAIILPVRYFLIQPFYVKGASMEPNFYDHEYLIVDEISYRLKEPKRGDIVVFRHESNQFFIKRVIGLSGEKVEIKDGQVIIYNKEHPLGQILDESAYLDSDVKTTTDGVTIVEDGHLFVLGDNREYSLDSRRFGTIKKSVLVGKTWFRGWPFDRLGWFETPMYNL